MIRYIFALTHGFRGRMALSASAGIVRVVAGLIFVALSKRAVDIATGSVEGNLGSCVAGLVCALIAGLLSSAVGNRSIELSEAQIKDMLQRRLFSRLMNSAWTGKEKYHTGNMLSALTDDCRVAAECLCRIVPTTTIAIVQLIGAFLFLWYFSPLLAVVLVVLLPLFLIAGKVFFKRMRFLTQQLREIESRLQEKMQESLQHRILLFTYQHTIRTLESISALHRSRYNVMRHRSDLTMYSRTAVFAGFESGYLAAFLWGIRGLCRGTVTFGMMTAYLQLAGQIQRPLAELAQLLPGLIHSHTAFSRLAEIESTSTEEDSPCPGTCGNTLPTGISLQDVSFTYPGNERPVLNHFTHIFPPGSVTAITGETGAGKSTLLRLILALLKPDRGEISLFTKEGERMMSVRVSSATRDRFVYVPQGNNLLSGTIRENLRIAKPDATDEEMRLALHDAAADFVFELKEGLDTICGERGAGLSEGQAQRIAIARGLLRSGTILLLDEISASLDDATETLLMQRLSERMSTHTILIATHRTGVLSYCDYTLRLKS